MGSNRTAGIALSTANFVWLLGSFCQAHRIPWDSAQVLQSYPPPHTFESLWRAGVQHGLRFRETHTRGFVWSRATYPLVAFRSEDEGRRTLPVLVVRAEPDHLLFFEPATPGPLAESSTEFSSKIGSVLLLVAPGQKTGAEARYGFREFLREAFGLKGDWRRVATGLFFAPQPSG